MRRSFPTLLQHICQGLNKSTLRTKLSSPAYSHVDCSISFIFQCVYILVTDSCLHTLLSSLLENCQIRTVLFECLITISIVQEKHHEKFSAFLLEILVVRVYRRKAAVAFCKNVFLNMTPQIFLI